MMDDLARRGIVLRVLALPSLDVATTDGRLIADILAALAAHERRRMHDRQRAGIKAARAAGRHLGRPPALTPAQIQHASSMRTNGESYTAISRVFRVDAETVRRALKRAPL
jgi:DNA invertase Pin-like site-specific DNA recombinase